MAFKLKSYKELLEMGKEAIDAMMVGLRIEAARNKAQGEIIKLRETMLTTETKINEACAQKEPDFQKICTLLDDYAIAERKLKQLEELLKALFPEN